LSRKIYDEGRVWDVHKAAVEIRRIERSFRRL
jgi:hypothetical protein